MFEKLIIIEERRVCLRVRFEACWREHGTGETWTTRLHIGLKQYRKYPLMSTIVSFLLVFDSTRDSRGSKLLILPPDNYQSRWRLLRVHVDASTRLFPNYLDFLLAWHKN